MPLLVVENQTDGNRAYCTMNKGIGAVLRFGANGPEVIEHLKWMRDVLGPVLSLALQNREPLNVNVLVTKAIAMGDEFHQRNIAASLAFLKEMAPTIVGLDIEEDKKQAVIQFLADTDQFFLNVMMASAKSAMDGARQIQEGTIVTAMCRNGYEFGIRIAGMGDEWFTGPVNTPKGLYFSGFSEEDASPDMGDSAITETFGVGGFAMIAAPAVTRFVGTGGFDDALRMLTLLKRPDIPVAAGAQVPLVKPLETAPEVHGETGLDGADLPEPGFLPQSLPAIELMARVLQESTEKVTLVVTGPMINAVLFLRTCPDLAREKLTKSSSWAGQWGWVTGNPASSSTSSSTPRRPRSC